MPQYLSTDPSAGTVLSTDQNAGVDLPQTTATEAFFGSHRPINEAGQPLDAPSGVEAFLNDKLNPALQGLAHPTSVGDFAGLAVPSMVPEFRAPLVHGVRQALDAAKGAPSLMKTPKAVMDRLFHWAFATNGELAREAAAKAAAAPRLAGKAQTLEGVLTDALNDVRGGAKPLSVSLPGGGAVRATGPVPAVPAPTKPRMGAYSSQPTPASAPPAAASVAPPAAAPRAPARSAPARTPTTTAATSVRLTAEESQALQQLVKEGYDEADVVQTIVQQRQAPAAPRTSGKPSLSAAETKEYQRLLGRGKSPDEAMQLIEGQRSMIQAKGLPTSEQTRRAVVDRNATGRWD